MPSSKILILTSGPLCRNPRVRKEAEALGDAGFDVTVMTVANHARFEAYDEEILRTAKYRKVALDQVSRHGASKIGVFISRLRTWIARNGVRFGFQSPQAFGPTAALGRLARGFSADLTIVHTEMPFCIGRDLLSMGRRVASDFEDWHSRDLLPQTRATRPMRLIERVERELLGRSAYSSTTSHALASALQAELGGILPLVLTNSFPLQAKPHPRTIDGIPSFIWFSQTIGPGRGLEPFLAAWRETSQPSRLCLLGEIDENYKGKLFERLPPERRKWLTFLPLTSPDELPAIIASHDIGLALELDFPTSKSCTISNKILQYLNAGIAVVASDTMGQREVFANAPGIGILTDLFQTSDLSAKLDDLLADHRQLTAMGMAARLAAETIYSWEREAPRLVAAVELALQSPAGLAR